MKTLELLWILGIAFAISLFVIIVYIIDCAYNIADWFKHSVSHFMDTLYTFYKRDSRNAIQSK